MTDYEAKFRSNYFTVKDATAFKTFCEQYELEFIEKDGRCGFLMSFFTDNGFPLFAWDHEKEEGIDVLNNLIQHLAEGQVAIIIETGNEKLRYLKAQAWVISSEGKLKHLDLTNLALEAAKELTEEDVTGPEY